MTAEKYFCYIEGLAFLLWWAFNREKSCFTNNVPPSHDSNNINYLTMEDLIQSHSLCYHNCYDYSHSLNSLGTDFTKGL